MANSRGSANIRSYMYPGKHPLLPPKSPFPSVSSSYGDYVQIPTIGPNVNQNKINHQRTSSESFLAEEQPSWLDDLLNEPETPVRRQGHRRSSSDSFAYLEAPSLYNAEYGTRDKYKNTIGTPFWGSREFDNYKVVQHPSPYTEASLKKQNNRVLNAVPRSSGLPSLKDNIVGHSSASLAAAKEASNISSTNGSQRQDITDTSSHDPMASSEKNDNSYVKSETDTKRAKQQFAQRSRVRKLQYIAELERNVQALQAEGSEASAEVEFLNQQTLILSMENKALKQRLESLAQEKLIKYLEQEVLEREIGRLRVLYQQQQQQQPQQRQQQQQPQQRQQQQQPQQRQQQLQQKASSSHRRSGSRDLDFQFANLSLKNKDPNSNHGPMSGPLHS